MKSKQAMKQGAQQGRDFWLLKVRVANVCVCGCVGVYVL